MASNMILASFRDWDGADEAIKDLEDNGYEPDELSIISKTKTRPGVDEDDDMVEGAAEGAATGGALGGVAGLLAGAGVIPALAGLFFGGPLAALLGATGVVATTISGAATGVVAGGLIGALTHLGATEEEAKAYEGDLNEGGVVIGVPLKGDDEDKVRDILQSNGGNRFTHISEAS